jgi:hypothetical protein
MKESNVAPTQIAASGAMSFFFADGVIVFFIERKWQWSPQNDKGNVAAAKQATTQAGRDRRLTFTYAQHGRVVVGCKSPVSSSGFLYGSHDTKWTAQETTRKNHS